MKKETYKEIWNSTFEKFKIEDIPWLTKDIDEKLSNIISKLNHDINNVLEIGCGLGYLSEYLGSKYENITAIDISKLMIDLCAKNENTKVKYLEEDFFDYLTTQKFDLIISQLLLHHIEDDDIDVFFSKINYLLEEDGMLILTFLLSPSDKIEKKKSFFYPHTVTYHTMDSVKLLSQKYFESKKEVFSTIDCDLGNFHVGNILFSPKANIR